MRRTLARWIMNIDKDPPAFLMFLTWLVFSTLLYRSSGWSAVIEVSCFIILCGVGVWVSVKLYELAVQWAKRQS